MKKSDYYNVATYMSIFIAWCRTFLIYGVGFILSLVFTLLLLPIALLPESKRFDNRWYFFISHLWARSFVVLSGVRFSIEGLHNLPSYPSNPSVILINHSSAFDIPLVEILLSRYPHIWISKELYGKIPLFGFMMRRMHVLLRRGILENSALVLKQAYKRVNKKNRHIVLFPEGRRYSDGQVHEFYNGFVVLASMLKRPIIPIAIWGLHKIYAKGSLLIDSSACEVKISIGQPMYFHEGMSRNEFVSLVHAWFVAEIARLSSETPRAK